MKQRRFLASLDTILKDLCATTTRMGATRVEVACGGRFDAIDLGLFRRAGVALSQGRAEMGTGATITVTRGGKPYPIPCKSFDRPLDNLRAAQRTISGLYQSFEGYGVGGGRTDAFDLLFGAVSAALTRPGEGDGPRPWHAVLQVPPTADRATITAAWRHLTLVNHPDKGGDTAAMAAINSARDEGLRQLASGPQGGGAR